MEFDGNNLIYSSMSMQNILFINPSQPKNMHTWISLTFHPLHNLIKPEMVNANHLNKCGSIEMACWCMYTHDNNRQRQVVVYGRDGGQKTHCSFSLSKWE